VRKHPQGAARAPDQLIRADIARVLGGGRAAQIDALFVVKRLGLLLRLGLWPVLAGVKVGPARARGAGPGGAPPGRRLRSGWFGGWQKQAEI
jgi:hypothetical protein